MNEYMFLIRNQGDGKASLSAEQHQFFLKACEVYIGKLKADNKLIAAQPIIREGVIIQGKKGDWHETTVDPSKEIQVGYYHIRAANISEAVAIAKENPEFAFVPHGSIEVRPLKISETTTGFKYPGKD